MLNVAIKAARAAGALINRAALDVEAVRISQKQINDFVTEVDHASEKAVIETLLGAYPGHGILAEESGQEYGAKDSEFVWIIDPLDGTTNLSTAFLLTASALRWRCAARSSKLWCTTPRATTCSPPPKGAVPT